MFRTEEMSEISLLVPRPHIEPVIRAIAKMGVLHQLDTSYLSREEDWSIEPWRDRMQQYQTLEQRLLAIMEVLQVPPRAGDEPPAEMEGDMNVLRDSIRDVEREAMPLVNELRMEQARLEEIESLIQRLDLIVNLDVDLSELRNLRFLYAQVGLVPSANLDRFNASLLHVPHVIMPLGEHGAGTLVALFGSAKDRGILERAAHSAYMSPVSMPEGYRGTPSAIRATLQEEAARLIKLQGELRDHARELAVKWGDTLRALLRRTRNDLRLVRAMDRFGQVRDVYLVAGWVPTRRIPEIMDAVQHIAQGQISVDITPAEQVADTRSVPTTLGNRGVFRAFQGLVTNYAFPGYKELDPTTLVAITFCLMFGLMFGDVGHGLVLALVGLAAMRGWVAQLAAFRGLGPVLFVGGLSAAFFGLLYGSVFGLETLLPALWLRPLDNIMSILTATVLLGVAITLIGFGANIANGLWARDWRRALFDRYGLAGVWFYLGLVAVIASAFAGRPLSRPLSLGLVLPPLALILLGEPLLNLITRRRPLVHESWGMFLVTEFFGLFESLISYLSNSLSYVRLGAFAVAHGGLSSVVFALAGMMGGAGSPWYWIVLALGNAFILSFEGLIVGIQTLRLEYYEFLTKFFQGGGVPYTPLTLSENDS